MEKCITPNYSPTLNSRKPPEPSLYIDQIPTQPSATPSQVPTTQPTTSRPRHAWVRPLRALLWVIISVSLPIGLALRSYGLSSTAFTNGTSGALVFWSNFILWPACSLGLLNFVWGTIRWFLRWRREHWRPGQVAGKLIGGGIWRSCVFAPIVLFSLFLIAPPIFRLISRNTIATQDQTLVTSDSLLLADYKSGLLSADQYLNYLLDSLASPSSLPATYQGSNPAFLSDYVSFADTHSSELATDTIQRVLELATLTNIDFDTDASGNLSSTFSLFSQPVYARTKATTLNKAKLSQDKHFVVFYTDTGNDAVSDDEVATLCTMLENIIQNYQSQLSLPYEYQLFTTSNSKTKKMGKVLEANSLPSNTTDTAMAVYIANPYKGNSSILATYAGRKFSEGTTSLAIKLGSLMGEETAKFYATTPAYPFINILPANLKDPSLALVTAHELGHHYSSNYCYANYNKSCPDDDFIDETTPNWFAVNVINDQPSNNVITGHYSDYIKAGTCYSIDTAVPEPPKEHACHRKGSNAGYPAVAFLQNYSEIVPDSANIFLDAIATGNALQKLHDTAGADQYQKIMTQLTERNLTKDYQQNTFHIDEIPRGEEIPCTDACSQNYYIAASSSRYLYFPTNEFQNVALEVSAPGLNTISILGQRGKNWSVISSSDQTASYEITEETDYDVIAFAIANYSITDNSSFTLKVTALPLKELLPEEEATAFDPNGLPIIPISNNCIGINFESVIDFPLQLYRIISQLDPSQDYSELFAEIEAENAELKSQLVYHYATICANQLKSELDFASVKSSLKRSFSPSFEIFHVYEPDFSLSIITAYDLLRLEGKFYFLMRVDNSLQLFTVRMFEKVPFL